MEKFENGIAKVKTTSKKFGFIDKKGKLIIDTVFKSVNSFIQGMAVVEGINNYGYTTGEAGKELKYEVGVIDTRGQFIIPYGKFEDICDFENGYFKIGMPPEPGDIEGYSRRIGFVDLNGKLIFAKDRKNKGWIEGNIHCGLAKMILYKNWIQKDLTYYSSNYYEGFVDLKGEIVINDTTFQSVKEFSCNRAFVQNEDNNYFIIDTKGKVISKEIYSRVIGDGFKNGIAFVEKDNQYGMIDTNLNFLIKPQFEGIDEVGFAGDYFFYFIWNQDPNSKYSKLYGIAKKDGSILLDPIMQEFNRNGFQNGLLKCLIDDKLSYLNREGKLVWKESDKKLKELVKLNIDFMHRGYFYAYSRPNKQETEGFGISENTSKKITEQNNFIPKKLCLIVDTEKRDTIFGNCIGVTVFLANASKNKIDFNAQDSRLSMKVQALNSLGKWKDIEYLPNSWCGNSYHTLTLDPDYYWTFLSPIYEGDFKTKLRIELKYIDPEDKSTTQENINEITIYSNEYGGSINPGQFWRKPNYNPNGLMDPYDE